MSDNNDKHIAIWLLGCCFIIFCMVVLGGVTRLTGSGLSMVEWAPIMGVLPPLNDTDWHHAFILYKQYPEYQKINSGMDIDGFKSIFWFEYTHRVLGRFIGFLFIVPMIYFLLQKQLKPGLPIKLILMFILGGLQGAMGWYMVKSGLVNNPHVSQYRLTAHLALALIIYLYILWVALELIYPKASSVTNHSTGLLRKVTWMMLSFAFVTVLSGGFVAGLKAGFAYNTFPLMGGSLVPENIFIIEPIWKNLFENVATVQFQHRLLATSLFLFIFIVWLVYRKVGIHRLRIVLNALLIVVTIQVALGISTLLLVVPVYLAAVHQAGAVLLLSVVLLVAFFANQYSGRGGVDLQCQA